MTHRSPEAPLRAIRSSYVCPKLATGVQCSTVDMVAVAAEYQPEVLEDIIGAIADAGISMYAYAADASGFRIFTRDPAQTQAVLKDKEFFCRVMPVLHLALDDKPGALRQAMHKLRGSSVQIISGFGVAHEDKGGIYLQVDDVDAACAALQD